MSDPVDHPKHYTSHPSGIEAIDVCEHMNFCRGNAVKYIWRAGLKGDELEDLKKAAWYLRREISRLELDRDYDGRFAQTHSPNSLRTGYAGTPLESPPPDWLKAAVDLGNSKIEVQDQHIHQSGSMTLTPDGASQRSPA